MPRRKKEWYIRHKLPLPETFEKKNYNWYVQRGMTPPQHLSIPKTIKDAAVQVSHTVLQPKFEAAVIVGNETDEQINERIKVRFSVLEQLVRDVVKGDVEALIVSGPPGLGKSYTVEQALKNVEKCRITKGFTRATGLYKLLYEYRTNGSILVFDDADSVFEDLTALNLLKTALDTSDERIISWLAENTFEDSDGESIPNTFTFEGSIIFITNYDFDHMIARGSKISKHLEALISRCHYVDLMMKSPKDFLVRIKQVVRDTDMLKELNKVQVQDVIRFIEDNLSSLREISLRTALKVATLRKSNNNWSNVAKITCCKV